MAASAGIFAFLHQAFPCRMNVVAFAGIDCHPVVGEDASVVAPSVEAQKVVGTHYESEIVSRLARLERIQGPYGILRGRQMKFNVIGPDLQTRMPR